MIGKIKYVLAILLAHLLIGCGAPKLYVVEGIVYDGLTGDPIENAEIAIDFSKLENGAYSNAFVPTGSTVSDEQGRYQVEFEAEKVVEFRIRTMVDDYFERFDTLSRESWSIKNSNDYDIAVYRKSNIDFRFFSSMTGVTLLFKLNTNSPGCADCCPNQNVVFSGMVDTTYTCAVYGNQTITYEGTRVSGAQTEDFTGLIDVFESTQSFEYEIK